MANAPAPELRRTAVDALAGRSDASMPSLLGVLGALQLADSAFPAGLYSFSHGLESAVQEGHVRTAQQLEHYLVDWLAWQVGPGDGVALAAAHRALSGADLDELVAIDCYAASTKLAREARESSTKSGQRLLATAVLLVEPSSPLHQYRETVVLGTAPGTYAVAFGAAAAALGVPRDVAVAGELHGAASSLCSAALRLLRIDHQQTQAILRRLAPRLVEIAAGAEAADWRALRPTGVFAELMQLRHEVSHVRLFMS